MKYRFYYETWKSLIEMEMAEINGIWSFSDEMAETCQLVDQGACVLSASAALSNRIVLFTWQDADHNGTGYRIKPKSRIRTIGMHAPR